MEAFAMFFAVVMIGLALGAVAFVGYVAGGIPAALLFAALLFGVYHLVTRESGRARPLKKDRLNAFQRPLSED
ncbi:hypothetical protein [Pseudooceanicola sp. HF7]|uniref:hypothetical protein n=1 Tax=Pseudooceanicola sp. HF7 TaxID=2721560 RepID=UPI00143039E9|nr:hypothetical protein [Pseudooceanicola sp. HF7]